MCSSHRDLVLGQLQNMTCLCVLRSLSLLYIYIYIMYICLKFVVVCVCVLCVLFRLCVLLARFVFGLLVSIYSSCCAYCSYGVCPLLLTVDILTLLYGPAMCIPRCVMFLHF